MPDNRSCCITGHRVIPDNSFNFVFDKLQEEVYQAISEGFSIFYSGFADGTDMFFSWIVAAAKEKHPDIRLIAAIPYRKRLFNKDEAFQGLLKDCDDIKVISEEYHPSCYFERNKFMANNSERVITVYDGRKSGGTYKTIQYARSLKKDIHIIKI